MKLENNKQAFFALSKAGLWEKEVRLSTFDNIDLNAIYQLAEEQTVIGLVAAGLEHAIDLKVPQEIILQFVRQTLQIEQRNKLMNDYVGDLVEKMRKGGIYTLLLKGQGIAQCYERPLWRSSGDVDFFLSEDNYKKAIHYFTPLASSVDSENEYNKHVSMQIDSWPVELHGTLRNGLWGSIDMVLDGVQKDIFFGGKVRSWMINNTQVFLPHVDEDVIYVFSHILQHFYKEGIGFRQICDWCRLLWTYRNHLNRNQLIERLRQMDVLSEWKTFAALSVDYLGMPEEAMPFYSSSKIWKRKSDKVVAFILKTGNFGHNRDYSYYEKYSYLICKVISLWRHLKDTYKYFSVFPMDSLKVLCSKVRCGFEAILKSKLLGI